MRPSKRITQLRRRTLDRSWWLRQAEECDARGYAETARQCRVFAVGGFVAKTYTMLDGSQKTFRIER